MSETTGKMSLLPIPICFGCAKAAQMSISCSECLRISCGNCFGLKDDDLDGSQARFVSLLTARVCPKCTSAAQAQACPSSNMEKEVEVVTVPTEPEPTMIDKVEEEPTMVTAKEEPEAKPTTVDEAMKETKLEPTTAIKAKENPEPEPTVDNEKEEPAPMTIDEAKKVIELEPMTAIKAKENPEPEPTVDNAKEEPAPMTVDEAKKESEPESTVDKVKEVPEPAPTTVNMEKKQTESEPMTIDEAEKEPEPEPTVGKGEEEPEPESTTVNKAKIQLCLHHGKEMNLFCLTCEVIICGDCFLAGGAHMRHQIDFVATVFQEKRAETGRKLARLEEKVGVLQREALHCNINLSTILAAEQAVLDEIDAICLEAKMSVNRLTVHRKRKLETRAQYPAKKQKLTATLHEMINQMSPAEFFEKQSEVYKQCDELIADCAPKGFHTLQFEDVGCELVPPYEMQKYTLMNFDGTFAGWPQHLTTSCGTMWNAFLRKKESLFIKVSSYEAEAAKHPYRLLVQLPHPDDISKNLTKTFNIHGPPKEDEIATVEYIQEQGFMRKNKELVVKVGLRPLNAITENRFYKNHCRALKSTIAELEKQVTSSGKDINCKFCIMYFSLNLSKTPKKSPEALHSSDLVDSSERHWCLRVYPFAQTLEETNLKVFVVLRKGTRTKCRYFIELMHDDPKKNVIQCTESSFETIDAGYGWHCFMERKRLLSDAGFYSTGVLRFRFGVQPLDK